MDFGVRQDLSLPLTTQEMLSKLSIFPKPTDQVDVLFFALQTLSPKVISCWSLALNGVNKLKIQICICKTNILSFKHIYPTVYWTSLVLYFK